MLQLQQQQQQQRVLSGARAQKVPSFLLLQHYAHFNPTFWRSWRHTTSAGVYLTRTRKRCVGGSWSRAKSRNGARKWFAWMSCRKRPGRVWPWWGLRKVAFNSAVRSTKRSGQSGGVLLVCGQTFRGVAVGGVAVCGRRGRLSGGVTSHAYRGTEKGAASSLRPDSTAQWSGPRKQWLLMWGLGVACIFISFIKTATCCLNKVQSNAWPNKYL